MRFATAKYSERRLVSLHPFPGESNYDRKSLHRYTDGSLFAS